MTTISNKIFIRPKSSVDGNQITFYHKPGELTVETLYDPEKGLWLLEWRAGTRKRHDSGFSTEGKSFTKNLILEELVKANAIDLALKVCPDPVTFSAIAKEMRDFIHRYFGCDEDYERVAVLYAMHTWFYEKFRAVPYLRFLGLPQSGKSRATDTVGALCYRPTRIAGATSTSAMFRAIEVSGGTVLFDEADFGNTGIGSEISKILNMGYEQGRPVMRNETRLSGEAKVFVPTAYDVFGPKIVSGRKKFSDDATETRCLTYTPVQTDRTDIPLQLPPEFDRAAEDIRAKAMKLRLENLDAINPTEETIRDLSRRTNQILLPLLALGNVIDRENGNDCYRTALVKFAVRQEESLKAASLDTPEALLVEELGRCTSEKVLLKNIVNKINQGDLAGDLSPRSAAGLLRDMGFDVSRGREGSIVKIDQKVLDRLEKRFGINTNDQEDVA